MTDWDAGFDGADINPNHGLASMAFIGLACAVVWVITAPFEIAARIRDRRSSASDDGCTSADWGSEHLHCGSDS